MEYESLATLEKNNLVVFSAANNPIMREWVEVGHGVHHKSICVGEDVSHYSKKAGRGSLPRGAGAD